MARTLGPISLPATDTLQATEIREKPLLERKKILKALLPRDPLLCYSEHVAQFGMREFARAQRAHEEGVIAKHATGLYYSGKRTREWLKFKAVPIRPRLRRIAKSTISVGRWLRRYEWSR
jgi:ATP-dependent DNA ligase